MKKLKFMAGIFVPLVILISLASCKNLIDTVDVQGYTYGLSEIQNDNIALYQVAADGHFSYEFIFASSGNSVTRKIVTGNNDIEEREGTFSVYKDRVELSFPASNSVPEENVTLTYSKSNGKLTGTVKIPAIEMDTVNDEIQFVDGETNSVTASFIAILRNNG